MAGAQGYRARDGQGLAGPRGKGKVDIDQPYITDVMSHAADRLSLPGNLLELINNPDQLYGSVIVRVVKGRIACIPC